MTVEEIESKIIFRKAPALYSRTRIIASLTLDLSEEVDDNCLDREGAYCAIAKDLKYQLLRMIYADQRSEMGKALSELQKWSMPVYGNTQEYTDAMNNVMKLAKRQ